VKLVLLSDIHLVSEKPIGRLDSDILDVGIGKLRFVLEYARSISAPILQAGDLTSTPRSWHILARLIELFEEYKEVPFYTIFGQHNMYMRSEDYKSTLLGVLIESGYMKLLDSIPKTEGIGNINLYGCSFGNEVPEVMEHVPGLNILVIHAPILQDKLWDGQRDYHSAETFLRKHRKYGAILCGDIHRKYEVWDGKRVILNIGSMMRNEATTYNLGHKPCFCVFDTDTRKTEWVEIPHSPPEVVLSRDHLNQKEHINEMLEQFIGAMQSSDFEGGLSFDENLAAFIEQNVIDKDVVKEIAEVREEEK